MKHKSFHWHCSDLNDPSKNFELVFLKFLGSSCLHLDVGMSLSVTE